jgi:hypothetical protein
MDRATTITTITLNDHSIQTPFTKGSAITAHTYEPLAADVDMIGYVDFVLTDIFGHDDRLEGDN